MTLETSRTYTRDEVVQERPIIKPLLFGKYCLLERVSVGGMAEVFRAKPFDVPDFQGYLALKRILPHLAEDSEFINMFIDEAKLTVRLNHPNIIRTYELGRFQNASYILMEFVSGRDLLALQKKMRRTGRIIDWRAAAFIAHETSRGLHHAHAIVDDHGNPMRVIHRDVSPQNVLLAYTGAVKVIDFGIAKAAVQSTRTQIGVLKGKMGYMSPEQVHGLQIDHRSDVFAVGTVLWEMLTNRRLFSGANEFETMRMVQDPDVPPAPALNPEVPPELDEVVQRALQPNRDMRFQTANELADALAPFIVGYSQAQFGQWMQGVFNEELENERYKHSEFVNIRTPDDVRERIQIAYAADPDHDTNERTGMWDAEIEPDAGEDLMQFADEHTYLHEGGFDMDLVQLDTGELQVLTLSEETAPEQDIPDYFQSHDEYDVYRTNLDDQESEVFLTDEETRRSPIVTGLIALVAFALVVILAYSAYSFLDTPTVTTTTVIVNVKPDGAEVFVDGVSVGKSPATLSDVTIGRTLEVSAKIDGFDAGVQKVVAKESLNTINLTLEPEAPDVSASIVLKDPPEGFVVLLDGRELELEAGANGIMASPGKHLVEVVAPGYRAWSEVVEIEEGLEIEPTFETWDRRITVVTPGKNARITLDGKRMSAKKPIEFSPFELHDLEIESGGIKWKSKVGYPDLFQEEWRIDPETTPEMFAEDYGWLTLSGTSPHWRIYIDDEDTGVATPLPKGKKLPISTGKRVISLRRGEVRHDYAEEFKPGQTRLIRRKLSYP